MHTTKEQVSSKATKNRNYIDDNCSTRNLKFRKDMRYRHWADAIGYNP